MMIIKNSVERNKEKEADISVEGNSNILVDLDDILGSKFSVMLWCCDL